MKPIHRRVLDIAYYRSRRAWIRAKRVLESLGGAREARAFERLGPQNLDPRIQLPAYMPLDEFIDLDQLKSLDAHVTGRVRRCLAEESTAPFHTGKLKRRFFSRTLSGSRLIALSQPKAAFSYHNLNQPECWEETPQAREFGPLMEFIHTLPFAGTARMIIMADDEGRKVTAHRDHQRIDTCHEFIWFRTNLNKPFYLQDVCSGERLPIQSHSAWFDTVNQYHGGPATGKLSISIRVDGVFTEEFRALMPDPGANKASQASLWSSLREQ